MTEKKRYDWDLNGIWDFENNKSDDYVVEYGEICDLLNKQDMFIKSQDKIIHLLHEEICRQSNRIEELASEDVVELLEKRYKDLLEARTYAMELILKINRLQRLIDDLGGEEMKRQMEVILND